MDRILPSIKAFSVFFIVFLCLLLTKAYSHISPPPGIELIVFGYPVPEGLLVLIPSVLSFPLSFLAGLLSYKLFMKEAKLKEINSRTKEINLLLEKEIKEKNQIQQELGESEKRFREMADLLPSAICEVDTNLKVTYANELGLRMFEITREELEKGFNGLMLIPENEMVSTSERIAKVMQGEVIDTIETTMLTKTGKTIPVIRNTNAINTNGDIKGLRLCITDISEQKAMQKELMHSSRMKSVAILAGGIAHKFNNLLNIITGNLELLQLENEDNPSVLKSIPPAFDAARQMVKLTDLLINYSKGGQLNIDFFDINSIIEKIILKPKIQIGNRISIHFENPQSELMVSADKGQIESVLQSVIQNSLEAMNEFGTIKIKTEEITSPININSTHSEALPGEKYVAVKIEDTGKGMDQITLDNLFDPFFSTKFPGRGLGMAAAYGIITAHGGWIDASSSPSQGTCITVYIPASSGNATDIPDQIMQKLI